MKDDTIKALTGMGCITAIVIVALLNGIDKAVLAGGVAVIAGLAGYEIKAILERKKKEQ